MDEWIYFLKNSEIKEGFSAKGIKEADMVLKRANMSDEERREYQRFVEVLSDKASIAETIAFKAKLLATQMAGKSIKEANEKIRKAVEVMIQSTNFSDENIANAFDVKIKIVREISKKMK